MIKLLNARINRIWIVTALWYLHEILLLLNTALTAWVVAQVLAVHLLLLWLKYLVAHARALIYIRYICLMIWCRVHRTFLCLPFQKSIPSDLNILLICLRSAVKNSVGYILKQGWPDKLGPLLAWFICLVWPHDHLLLTLLQTGWRWKLW